MKTSWSYPPFDTLKVVAEVEWDLDDSDGVESPPSKVTLEYTSDELEATGLLVKHNEGNPNWEIPLESFEEGLSNDLSDEYGFCHYGFTYHIIPKTKRGKTRK